MSGIYIPGMEMPKSCFYCTFRLKVDPDTFVCLATNEHIEETFARTIERRNGGDCPLISVPDHGRLIDAGALMEHKSWVVDAWSADMSYRTEAVNVCDIINAPTIIPTSGGEK